MQGGKGACRLFCCCHLVISKVVDDECSERVLAFLAEITCLLQQTQCGAGSGVKLCELARRLLPLQDPGANQGETQKLLAHHRCHF
jgi:hypothetical protein